MITVEKALKSKKSNNLLEGDKKKGNKTILWVALGLLGAYLGYRMLKGNNEKVSTADT